jgi:fructokinase
LDNIAGQPFQLVFGTLGQRNEVSRSAIQALRQKAAFCYYDVNLRPPFTGRELVVDSLHAADLVKVNEEELAIVGDWLAMGKRDSKDLADSLRHRLDLTALVVTRGADGAMLASADGLFEEAGVAVAVVDTVGAGDAFFAALVAGFRAGLSWRRTLALANARGSYVASCRGATPPMERESII